MRNMITVFIISISSILLTLGVPEFTVTAEEKNDISIHVLPDDVLYDINNMKPGDWAPRTITVQNKGEMDFDYQMSLKNDGPEKLFNELILEISAANEELYNGKLADFESLPLRGIDSSSEEELDVTIRFPEHLGNEFQGLDAKFLFTLTAEGAIETNKGDQATIGGAVGSDGDGSVLPSTATNMFNILMIGGVLLASGGLLVAYNRRRSKNIDKQSG